MSDLFGNHIVGFPTRRLICCAAMNKLWRNKTFHFSFVVCLLSFWHKEVTLPSNQDLADSGRSLRKLAHAKNRFFIGVKIEIFLGKKIDIFNIFAQNIHRGFTLDYAAMNFAAMNKSWRNKTFHF